VRAGRAPRSPLAHSAKAKSSVATSANDNASSHPGVLRGLKGLFRGRKVWKRKPSSVAPAAKEGNLPVAPTITSAASDFTEEKDNVLDSTLSAPEKVAVAPSYSPARILSSNDNDIGVANGDKSGVCSPKEVVESSTIHELDSRCARVEDSLLSLLVEVRDIRMSLQQQNSIAVPHESSVDESSSFLSPGNLGFRRSSLTRTMEVDKASSPALTTPTNNASGKKPKLPRAERLASRAERIEATVEAAARAVAEVSALENSHHGGSAQNAARDTEASGGGGESSKQLQSSSEFRTRKRHARNSSVRRSGSKERGGERLPKDLPKLDTVASAPPLLEPLNLRSKPPNLMLASPPGEIGPTPTRVSKDLSALRELLHSRDGRERVESNGGGCDIKVPIEAGE